MKFTNDTVISEAALKLMSIAYLVEGGISLDGSDPTETKALYHLLGVQSLDEIFAARDELVREKLIAPVLVWQNGN